MRTVFYVGYLGIGFVQLFAIMGGFQEWLGIGTFLSFLGAFFITYIPLVGQALGVYGAVSVWEWSWTQALLLFVGPWILAAGFAGVSSYKNADRLRSS